MGDGKAGGLEAEVAEQDDIDIDVARALVDDLDATHGAFDGLGELEKGGDEEGGTDLDDHVEEVRLVEDVGGRGFDDGGAAGDFEAGGGEEAEGFVQICFAVSEIGAEAEVGGGQDVYSVAGEGKPSEGKRLLTWNWQTKGVWSWGGLLSELVPVGGHTHIAVHNENTRERR